MANLPDNIVYIMAVDNAGNVVNIDADLIKSVVKETTIIKETAPSTTVSIKKSSSYTPSTTASISPSIAQEIQQTSFEINADSNYIPLVNSDKSNFDNSLIYQINRKIGINNKSPQYTLDISGGSINIDTSIDGQGIYINKYNVASFTTLSEENQTFTLNLGDDSNVQKVSLYELILRGQVLQTPINDTRFLVVDDDGVVSSTLSTFKLNDLTLKEQFLTEGTGSLNNDWYISSSGDTHTFNFPNSSRTVRGLLSAEDYVKFDDKGVPDLTDKSVIFSNGITLVEDNGNFQYDSSTHTLKVTHIGSTGTSVSASSNWTFSGSINVPTPTSGTNAATKQYVDDLALTGLKIGAPVKTVSLSNITLSGNQTISGYTTSNGDRVLVIGQTDATENGVYITDDSTWSRGTGSDTDQELRGYQYLIEGATSDEFGARYGNTNTSVITIGTTDITYQKIAAGETDPVFTAHVAYGIDDTDISHWETAYDKRITGIAFSGTSTTKTLTVTLADLSTLSDTFTIPVLSIEGTANRISVSSDAGTYTIDIDAAYAGQDTITTVGTIGTGTWQGTAIADTYISSADTWNGKQDAITLTTTGTSGAATFDGTTLNIPTYKTSYSLDNLSDVAISSASLGKLLRHNGTEWVDWTPTFLTSYTETDTLQSVTSRTNGNTTDKQIGITNLTDSTATNIGALIVSGGIGVAKKLYVGGTITSQSTVTATAFYESSDIRFKNIIEKNPYIDLTSLDTIKFTREGDLDKDVRYGYSAQDVMSINSDFVKEDQEGKLFVNYTDIHTVKIAQLEKRIKELEEKLASK